MNIGKPLNGETTVPFSQVDSPTLPEAQREKMGKYLENARHRLRTGKDMYAAADCALM